MTGVLPSVSPDRRQAGAVPPGLRRGRAPLTVTAHPGVASAVVLTVCGEVDLYTSLVLRDGLLAHLPDTSARVVVDLTGVGFFAAAGIAILATARQAAVAAGIGFCVVANSRAVLLPLRITGLDRVLDLHPDLAHGLRCQSG
ncbi:STAS domain-containing protein [Labedaea rhizosphaerae]|nr:STAS domain-containing protein [Labedaea rhizosphaerae]